MTKQTFKRMVWLLCITVALTACKEKIEIIEVVRSIKTLTVSKQASEKIFKFSGVVAAVDSSGLSFQVGGQVETVQVDIGDRVTKDQELAALDPEPPGVGRPAAETGISGCVPVLQVVHRLSSAFLGPRGSRPDPC